MTIIENRYISAGGNRHPSAADWDHDAGSIAFGSDRNIALWKPHVRFPESPIGAFS